MSAPWDDSQYHIVESAIELLDEATYEINFNRSECDGCGLMVYEAWDEVLVGKQLGSARRALVKALKLMRSQDEALGV